MTKAQGWILIIILVVVVLLGVGAYAVYFNNQHEATAQQIAACLNQCNVQSQNGQFQNNACFTTCLQNKSISLPGYDTASSTQ